MNPCGSNSAMQIVIEFNAKLQIPSWLRFISCPIVSYLTQCFPITIQGKNYFQGTALNKWLSTFKVMTTSTNHLALLYFWLRFLFLICNNKNTDHCAIVSINNSYTTNIKVNTTKGIINFINNLFTPVKFVVLEDRQVHFDCAASQIWADKDILKANYVICPIATEIWLHSVNIKLVKHYSSYRSRTQTELHCPYVHGMWRSFDDQVLVRY